MVEEEKSSNDESKTKLTDQISTTDHSVEIGGEVIQYTATTGTMVFEEEVEDPKENDALDDIKTAKATIFFTAYTRKPKQEDHQDEYRRQRPVTFAFNGGPGSSSVWLHMGLLGPRRVQMEPDGKMPAPPYELVDNAYSLLDATDLIFIDPVTTGFSRPVAGEDPKQFHGFKKDIESVGDFIRLYVTRYKRWRSPKYLIGESYGTTRAAGLSGYLQERHGMFLNGVMLVSSVLNFQTARFIPGNDLPPVLFLPTYAATAWYHQKLPQEHQSKSLDELLLEVEAFALGDYNQALMLGDALNKALRSEIVQKLSAYTGLSTEYIKSTNLRINIHRFVKELLRSERRTIGRLDSRFTGIDRDAAGEQNEFDPSYAAIHGPYTACLNDYVRSELNFESDLPYEILTYRVYPWKYMEHQNEYVNVGETLRKAMSYNPYLKVHVANGYFDMATPYLATRYTFDHLELEPEQKANLSMSYYPAGHMMYIQMDSLQQLKTDLAEFIIHAKSTD